MNTGRLGVWYAADKHQDPNQMTAFVQTVEKLGYTYTLVSGVPRL